MSSRRIVIIGAGPTGLGAAYRLQELGHKNFRILEAQRLRRAGSPRRFTTSPNGFTWDIGGHVMFRHYAYYDEFFDKLMGDDTRSSCARAGCGCRPLPPLPVPEQHPQTSRKRCYECLLGLIEAQSAAQTDVREFRAS